MYSSRGTLVSRTCARAVAAPRGKACRVTAKVLHGSSGAIQEQSIQAKETRPRQEELAGKQGTSRRLAATPRASRQGPRAGKLAGPTRGGPRQGTCRGRRPFCAHAPAHPPTVALGASPGARGGRLCSQRCAVACEADKIAIVANGGAPNGPFLHCLCDSDGHLMPLSPAVRVRYDTL